MTSNYPDDADGQALRRVAETADMSKPMDVDFFVAVPEERAGANIAELAGQRGYRTKVERDSETGKWTCYCTRTMVPTYEAIVSAQKELEDLARPHGGYSD